MNQILSMILDRRIQLACIDAMLAAFGSPASRVDVPAGARRERYDALVAERADAELRLAEIQARAPAPAQMRAELLSYLARPVQDPYARLAAAEAYLAELI